MSETTSGAPAAAPAAAAAATAAPGTVAPVTATPVAGAAAATTPAVTPPTTTLLGDAPVVDPAAPAAPAADAPITPVAYEDFALPDGIAKDGALLDVFRTEAGKLGIPQAQAQALVTAIGTRMAADAKAAGEATWQTWVDTNDKWAAEIKADPVIGGTKFEAMKVTVSKLFDDYVGHVNTPERKAFNEALLLTGAGNNPAVVRAIAKIAAAHTEGSFVNGSPGRGQVDRAAILYPTAGQPNGAVRPPQG